MVIRLQRVGDFIFPTDCISKENFGRDKISVRDLDIISPRLVKHGFILKIENF